MRRLATGMSFRFPTQKLRQNRDTWTRHAAILKYIGISLHFRSSLGLTVSKAKRHTLNFVLSKVYRLLNMTVNITLTKTRIRI